jgi:hypothetical protein
MEGPETRSANWCNASDSPIRCGALHSHLHRRDETAKMLLVMRQDPDRHAYSRIHYFSTPVIRLFRLLRVFMVSLGVFLLVLGLDTAFVRTNQTDYPIGLSLIAMLVGLVMLWANDFDQGRVTVTPTRIRTRNLVARIARKDEIESLDIVHSQLGKPETTTPTLHLRGGRAISLQPLVWSAQVATEQPGWSYFQQQKLVHEIRDLLGVAGQD